MSQQRQIKILDGGLSTELVRLGFNPANTRLWTGKSILDRPDLLKQAHLNFIKSGAEVITTASYQLSIELIKQELKCSELEAKNLIKKSVQIVREAINEANEQNVLIAGSVGPYGACLCDGSEFRGDYVHNLTEEFLVEWHRPRLENLLEEKVDLIAIETIPSIKEASAILALISNYPNVKAWLSFSCKDESELCIGDKFSNAYRLFENNQQLIAIGINCTLPNDITGLLESVLKENKASKPFIVYPNDAKRWNEKYSKYLSDDGEDPIEPVLEAVPKWIELGAEYIGGCCNIDSENLRQIKDLIKKS